MHTPTKTLPVTLQNALFLLNYHRSDIFVRAAETFCPMQPSGQGRRAFVACVDLATGATKTYRGSWGGANMFNPQNAVDLDTTPKPIPPGCVIVEGSEGGGRPVYASLRTLPATLAPLLPEAPKVTDREASILAVVRSYTSAYRKEEFRRMGVQAEEITCLVVRNLLKANKAGAISITTEGKNACAHIRGY